MREGEAIARLRDLRRLRERRARETVIRRNATAVDAEKAVRDASEATALHLQQAASEEKAQLGSLVGQQVDVNSIHQLQGLFHQHADELSRLREAEDNAAAAAQRHEKDLVDARDEYRTRTRAVSKLDLVLEKLSSDPFSGKTAREELREEEATAEYGTSNKK